MASIHENISIHNACPKAEPQVLQTDKSCALGKLSLSLSLSLGTYPVDKFAEKAVWRSVFCQNDDSH